MKNTVDNNYDNQRFNLNAIKNNINFNKKYVIISFIILMIIGGFFAFNLIVSKNSSKSSLLQEFREVVINKKNDDLLDIIRVNENKILEKESKPLIAYLDSRINDINNILRELNSNEKSGIFTLNKKDGKIKDEYYININTIDFKIQSNESDAIFFIGGKKYKSGDIVENFIPGTYDVYIELETKLEKLKTYKLLTILDEETLNIDLPVVYLTINSNHEDAEVMINNKKTGLKVSEFKNYGPLSINDNTKICLQKKFPWGVIKSDEVLLDDTNFLNINLNMVNDTLSSDIKNVCNEFYKSIFESLNNKNKNLIVNCLENIKNKAYNEFEKSMFILSNKYKIDDLQVGIEKSDFKYENSQYKASVVTNVNYEVSKKLLPFSKDKYEDMFLLNLVYEDGWYITNIEKFNVN